MSSVSRVKLPEGTERVQGGILAVTFKKQSRGQLIESSGFNRPTWSLDYFPETDEAEGSTTLWLLHLLEERVLLRQMVEEIERSDVRAATLELELALGSDRYMDYADHKVGFLGTFRTEGRGIQTTFFTFLDRVKNGRRELVWGSSRNFLGRDTLIAVVPPAPLQQLVPEVTGTEWLRNLEPTGILV